MSDYNIVTADFANRNRVVMTDVIYQYDYGQKLQVQNVPALPQTFEAHFSNIQHCGSSITVAGIDGMVDIPNTLIATGKRIYCWIYVTETGSGETVYQILMPVQPRPMPEYYDVTDVGVFDSVVQQVGDYAATATAGAENAGASASAAAASADAAAGSASGASGSAAAAAGSATAAAQSETNAAASATAAAESATAAAQSRADAALASSAASTAATEANNAKADAVTAAGRAESAATAAGNAASGAGQAASAAVQSAQSAYQSADRAETAASGAEGAADAAETAATTATNTAGEATQAAQPATGAASTAQTAASTATSKADAAAQSASGAAQSKTDAEAAATRAEQAAASLVVDSALSDASTNPVENRVITAEVTQVKNAIDVLNVLNDRLRYGVSNVGQSAHSLTRLYDSVGMIAQVGTDGDNSGVINDFDAALPFMRRKCVGKWYMVSGVPVFRVNAYYGDPNYTEDGSMGDYVAVECPRCYYYFKDGVLAVSAHQYEGYTPFGIFCRNHNPQNTIERYYLPAYALAKDANGHAVSLPNLDNFQGCYKEVMDACRTYDGDAGSVAFCQPMDVNFYEWAMYTIEFATTNCQSVMQGCAGLRHNNDDRATLRSDGKWLLNNYYASRVVGEYVSIQPTNVDINHSGYYASHKITAIIRCDANGNESSSGTHQLVTTEDLGLGREYEVGAEYRFAARPYRTGECNGVSTPSGSPVNNTDSYHPMKYRWRENVFSNQYKTIADVFNMRVNTDADDNYLEWYYLPDPASYTPSSNSKPDAAELATDAFVKLDVETAHENYVNGYIKSKKYSQMFPDVWIPYETTGASASTYFADYANLVSSLVVRSLRLGGYWTSGANAGFSYAHANNAPSYSNANFGGDLFFPQSGVNAV